jgi:hypothetical protein
MDGGCLAIPDRTLLVHCTTTQLNRSARIADRAGGGLVVSPDRQDLVGLLTAVRYLREMTGYGRPVLLDAARYAGRNRLPARAPFDPRWLRRQRELGGPVLTDSGYVAADDEVGLGSILHRTAHLDGAIALLPLHVAWLRDPLRRALLLRAVRAAGVCVALVLEYGGDPFALVGVADGLLELLSCEVPVLLLRCDLSALGALCCGARAAAIGTVGSLRHLLPVPYTPPGPRPRPTHTAAVFRPCLSYRRVSAIARARRRHPDEPLWTCDCPTCEGRTLDWLATEPRQELLAFQHSMHVNYQLRDELVGANGGVDTPVTLSRQSWRARCAAAASRQQELGWTRAVMLDRWQEALAAIAPAIPAQRTAGHTPVSRRR